MLTLAEAVIKCSLTGKHFANGAIKVAVRVMIGKCAFKLSMDKTSLCETFLA